MPQLFNESKKYFKRDKTADVISNNMGVLFAELGDYEGAEKMFNQAIELTPDNDRYEDPKLNLKNIN